MCRGDATHLHYVTHVNKVNLPTFPVFGHGSKRALMDTELHASVATFRVYTSGQQRPLSAPKAADRRVQTPPTRSDRMAATPVTEGPLILSRLATNEMSYLQVNNFTRAIMPRSHIWRVSDTELVVPASFTNYWLITFSGSRKAVVKLDQILRSLCKYDVLVEDDLDEELLEVEDTPKSPSIDCQNAEASSTPETPEHKLAHLHPAREGLSKERYFSNSANPHVDHRAYGSIKAELASPPASPPASPSVSPQAEVKPGSALPCRESIVVSRKVASKARLITPPEMENVQMIKQSNASMNLKTPTSPALTTPTMGLEPLPSHTTPLRSSTSPSRSDIKRYPMHMNDEGSNFTSPKPYEDLLLPVRDHSTLHKSLDTRFGPRFSHPLIPSSHTDHPYPSTSAHSPVPARLALARRELLAVGPNSLHQDVTTVGGYIGLKAVNRILRKT